MDQKVNIDQTVDWFEGATVKMLERLGLSRNFLQKLIADEDDWAFTIKIYALVESAINYLVTKVLKKPELEDFISKLRIKDKREIIELLKCADSDHIKRIKYLTEKLRNKLVHRIEEVHFTFDAYLSVASNWNDFKNSFGSLWKDPIFGVSRDKFLKENPKLTIGFWAIVFLADVYIEEMKVSSDKMIEEMGRHVMKATVKE